MKNSNITAACPSLVLRLVFSVALVCQSAFLSDCLFVSEQHYSKSYEQFSMKYYNIFIEGLWGGKNATGTLRECLLFMAEGGGGGKKIDRQKKSHPSRDYRKKNAPSPLTPPLPNDTVGKFQYEEEYKQELPEANHRARRSAQGKTFFFFLFTQHTPVTHTQSHVVDYIHGNNKEVGTRTEKYIYKNRCSGTLGVQS